MAAAMIASREISIWRVRGWETYEEAVAQDGAIGGLELEVVLVQILEKIQVTPVFLNLLWTFHPDKKGKFEDMSSKEP